MPSCFVYTLWRPDHLKCLQVWGYPVWYVSLKMFACFGLPPMVSRCHIHVSHTRFAGRGICKQYTLSLYSRLPYICLLYIQCLYLAPAQLSTRDQALPLWAALVCPGLPWAALGCLGLPQAWAPGPGSGPSPLRVGASVGIPNAILIAILNAILIAILSAIPIAILHLQYK